MAAAIWFQRCCVGKSPKELRLIFRCPLTPCVTRLPAKQCSL